MMVVREYLASDGRSPFGVWFDHLNAEAAAKVSVALTRLESGNFSNVKGVGGGVYEYRIDFLPGYRIYLGKTGISSSFCWLEGRRNANQATSSMRGPNGRITSVERQEVDDGSDSRF
jgi:putative addiction module killer protein